MPESALRHRLEACAFRLHTRFTEAPVAAPERRTSHETSCGAREDMCPIGVAMAEAEVSLRGSSFDCREFSRSASLPHAETTTDKCKMK